MAATHMTVERIRDRERAIATLTLAFKHDPVMRWFFPEPDAYLSGFPEVVRLLAGKAFEHDAAFCVEGSRGTALWLPPDVHPDLEQLASWLEHNIDASRHEEVFGWLEEVDSYHIQEPHWYLPVIGVDPVWQGHGYGSALLREALSRCDEEGMPAYLESSNAANLPLYKRHGFEVLAEVRNGSAPPLWPMLRRAR
jgi:ribosomal protein S18 acetylase RimI-like enzyme